MIRISSNAITVSYLTRQGFLAETVQQWIARPGRHHGVRRDLFGIIDVIAVKPGVGIFGIQATLKSKLAEHRSLLLGNQSVIQWLQSGGRCQLYSWRKVGAKGSKLVWKPRVEEAVMRDGSVFFVLVEECKLGENPSQTALKPFRN